MKVKQIFLMDCSFPTVADFKHMYKICKLKFSAIRRIILEQIILEIQFLRSVLNLPEHTGL